MISIDLNCDMGEGMLNDDLIMPFISSANIACGYHAGSNNIIQKTIQLALKYNVAIGAHPGFNDKKNFGRTELKLSPDEYGELISEQLYVIQKFVDAAGAILHHVKPHGGLYNMSAADAVLANIIAKAVQQHNPSLILYGLSNSYSISEAEKLQLATAAEAFADRTYTDEGTLTPRTQPGALINNKEQSLQQVLQLIKQQHVISVNNKTVPVKADTICIHGDDIHAVQFAQHIFKAVKENNIAIKTI